MHTETIQDQLYEDLRKSIDKMPVGMPATESGVELRILKRLFTPFEAKIALHLNIIQESVIKIHKRVKKAFPELSIVDLEEILDALVIKGSIMEFGGNSDKKYSYAMFAIGMFEYQVDKLDKDFANDCEEYLQSNFAKEFHKTKIPQMRAVPINKTIANNQYIMQYDDIRSMVEKTESDEFGVMNCICKQAKDLQGESCKVTEVRETCILFPSASSHFRDRGVVRTVTRKETLQLLDQAEEEGLVLQPGNTQRPGFICACCGDCCGVLSSAKLLPKPAQLFTTNYYAEIDKELCIDCGTCVDRCQMEAIIEGEFMTVDLDRCIGCGLCATKCAGEAITLQQKVKTFIPPKNNRELYQNILMKKSNPLTTVKTAIKIVAGKKV